MPNRRWLPTFAQRWLQTFAQRWLQTFAQRCLPPFAHWWTTGGILLLDQFSDVRPTLGHWWTVGGMSLLDHPWSNGWLLVDHQWICLLLGQRWPTGGLSYQFNFPSVGHPLAQPSCQRWLFGIREQQLGVGRFDHTSHQINIRSSHLNR